MATARKGTAGKKTAGRTSAGKKTAAKKTSGRSTAGKKSAAKKTTSRGRADALTMLKADHDLVKKLFNRYERTKDNMSDGDKSQMVQQLCGELTVHAQIEEEIFYPALRNVADDDLNEMLDEAAVEHTGAKDLIAQLQGGKPTDPLYDAKVPVLGEQVKHHAEEEETNIFRKARRAREADLTVLREQMEARKTELKGELGLESM